MYKHTLIYKEYKDAVKAQGTLQEIFPTSEVTVFAASNTVQFLTETRIEGDAEIVMRAHIQAPLRGSTINVESVSSKDAKDA